jgi:hypothetical protein
MSRPRVAAIGGYRRTSARPGLGRLNVLGGQDLVRGGTILAGPPPVARGPLPVLGDVAVAGFGEQFVQVGRPVVRTGRVHAHRRHPLASLAGSQARGLG